MMPKLIALALRRTIGSMPSTGTPKTWLAVMAWMSLPSWKACFEGLDVGDVGEQAQLDLRVVDGEQLVALLGHEGAADLAALLGAHRDVLQIGIGRGEPAGGRDAMRV